MTKETKPKEEAREPKPKYRSVIPADFKIRRSPSPMHDILREAESPVSYSSPSTIDSPSIDASPSVVESPVISTPLALPPDSPSTNDSPITHDTPKPIREGNYRKGDSRVNHDFFDERISGLEPLAQLLYFHLNRYREGTSNLTVVLSWKRLSERIPVTDSTLRRAYKRLNKAGLAFKDREVYGKNGAQGIIFRVITPASPSSGASPSTPDTHKRSDQKENLKKEVSRCDKCESTGGFLYPNGIGGGGVIKCDHS
jgi:hypothetical protein